MAVSFIFFMLVVALIITLLGIFIDNLPIGIIGALGLMVLGIDILINGMQNIQNILTIGIGTISVGMGAWVSIGGSLDYIENIGG